MADLEKTEQGSPVEDFLVNSEGQLFGSDPELYEIVFGCSLMAALQATCESIHGKISKGELDLKNRNGLAKSFQQEELQMVKKFFRKTL